MNQLYFIQLNIIDEDLNVDFFFLLVFHSAQLEFIYQSSFCYQSLLNDLKGFQSIDFLKNYFTLIIVPKYKIYILYNFRSIVLT